MVPIIYLFGTYFICSFHGFMKKIPKYNEGDILNWTFQNEKEIITDKVRLIERYDRRPNERVAWLVTSEIAKNGFKFAVAEDDLSPSS